MRKKEFAFPRMPDAFVVILVPRSIYIPFTFFIQVNKAADNQIFNYLKKKKLIKWSFEINFFCKMFMINDKNREEREEERNEVRL